MRTATTTCQKIKTVTHNPTTEFCATSVGKAAWERVAYTPNVLEGPGGLEGQWKRTSEIGMVSKNQSLRFSKTKNAYCLLLPPDTAYSLARRLGPVCRALCSFPCGVQWGAPASVPGLDSGALSPAATLQVRSCGWAGSASAPPLPCPPLPRLSRGSSLPSTLICQAELARPDPHCLPTLSFSRHLGSVPSCSPRHGCLGDARGPAAPLAVHLQPLWLHQEPLNWLCL